jgi:small subunit ribosomal protein S1
VHLSDLSWQAPGEEAVKSLKKGDEVETVVLSIDVERERISLGIKQLAGDPFGNFVSTHDKGAIVKGNRSLDRVQGRRRSSSRRTSRDTCAPPRSPATVWRDVSKHLQEGQEGRGRHHQHRPQEPLDQPLHQAEDRGGGSRRPQEAHAAETSGSAGTTNLGALLKAKLGAAKDKE